MVSGAPEMKTLKRNDDDYLVLLVCDGITDAFDNENLFQIVEAFVNDNPLEGRIRSKRELILYFRLRRARPIHLHERNQESQRRQRDLHRGLSKTSC